MAEVQRKHGPFAGISRILDRTEQGASALWDGRGVYHRERGRLHGCFEAKTATATGPDNPSAATSNEGAVRVYDGVVVRRGDATGSALTGTDYYPDEGLSSSTEQVIGAAAALNWPPSSVVYWPEADAFVFLGHCAYLNGSTLVLLTRAGGYGGTASGSGVSLNVSGDFRRVLNAAFEARGKIAFLDDANWLYGFDGYDLGASTMAISQSRANSASVGYCHVPGPFRAKIFGGRLWVFADGEPVRVYHRDNVASASAYRGTLNGIVVAGDVATAGRPVIITSYSLGSPVSITAAKGGTSGTLSVAISNRVGILTAFTAGGASGDPSAALKSSYIFRNSGTAVTFSDALEEGLNASATRFATGPLYMRDVEQWQGALVGVSGPRLLLDLGTGTISRSSSTITGSGTAFTTEVRPGDLLLRWRPSAALPAWADFAGAEVVGRVVTVTSNTSITVDLTTTDTVSGESFAYVRAPDLGARNTLLFSGRPVNTANGVSEDRRDWTYWLYNNTVLIGEAADGEIVRLVSLDARLIVFFERAVYQISGTPPIGGYLPPDFGAQRLSAAAGLGSYEACVIGPDGQTIYFSDRNGCWMLFGGTVRQIDDQVRDHPEFRPPFAHAAEAGGRVYFQEALGTSRTNTGAVASSTATNGLRTVTLGAAQTWESGDDVYVCSGGEVWIGEAATSGSSSTALTLVDPYFGPTAADAVVYVAARHPRIWIYDTLANTWTYTVRVNGDDEQPGAAAYVPSFIGTPGRIGGLANPYRFDASTEDRVMVPYWTGTAWAVRELNGTPHDDARLYHGVRVQTAFDDAGTPADKSVRRVTLYARGDLSTDGTGATEYDGVRVDVLDDEAVAASRTVAPKRSNAQTRVYSAPGSAARLDAASVAVGDGVAPLKELQDVWTDLQVKEGRRW